MFVRRLTQTSRNRVQGLCMAVQEPPSLADPIFIESNSRQLYSQYDTGIVNHVNSLNFINYDY